VVRAVSVLSLLLRSVFEIAAACGKLSACLLCSDRESGIEVLVDHESRDLVTCLLRWTLTEKFRMPGSVGCAPVLWAWHEECGGWVWLVWGPCADGRPGCGHRGQLHSDEQVILLRKQTIALTGSGASIGIEILDLCGDGQ